MAKDLYIVGAGGGPNFGDDLIGRVWIEYLSHKYPDRTIWLDTRNAGVTAGYFSNYKNVKSVDTFWKLRELSASAGKSINDRVEWLSKKINNLGTPKYDIHLKNIKNNVESIHFVGGGYLNSMWQNNLLLLVQASLLKEQNLSLKIYMTGVGLTPVTDDFVKLFKKYTYNFDFIECRDKQSAELLKVTEGIDDVWMSFSDALNRHKPVWKKSGNVPEIMVLLQKDFNSGKEQQLLDKTIEIIRSQSNFNRNTVIGVAEAIPSKDYWVLPEIKKILPDNKIVFYSFQHLWEKGFPAGEKTMWITTRFHYHLIGSALGSRGIVLTTGSKYYSVKHMSLIDNGTNWSVMNIDDVSSYEATQNINWRENSSKLGNKKFRLAESLYYFK